MVRGDRHCCSDVRRALSCTFSLFLSHLSTHFLSPPPQWFGTYNYLSAHIPPPSPTSPHLTLLNLSRRALIGFVASVISDTTSNSLRVLKTYRQVNDVRIGYVDAAREVVRVDGWKGLFGRGLKTRIWANGAQGVMFTVLWGWFMDV